MDDKFMPRPAGVGKTTGNANLPLPVRDDDGWKEEGDARSGGDGGAMIVKNRPQAEEAEEEDRGGGRVVSWSSEQWAPRHRAASWLC